MIKKDKSKICILIVPHTKKVKRILIPPWLPKGTLTLISSLLIVSLVWMIKTNTYQNQLKKDSEEKTSIILSLEEENKNKKEELANLHSQTMKLREKTEEVENKLDEIDKLQRRLERMANMESPSRSGRGGRDDIILELDDLTPNAEMDIMKDLLEDKKLELENFIIDLEAQFDYLESVPDLMPTNGRLTSKFGNRRDPFTRRIQFHQGIDIANSSGTEIKAAAKGKVTFSGPNGAYGRTIIIDHGYGYKTLYAHNRKLLVSVGDKVEKGQVISNMGSTGRSTGSHLHFEIHKDNKPIDPLSVLNNWNFKGDNYV